jgi:hypothetical protein
MPGSPKVETQLKTAKLELERLKLQLANSLSEREPESADDCVPERG